MPKLRNWMKGWNYVMILSLEVGPTHATPMHLHTKQASCTCTMSCVQPAGQSSHIRIVRIPVIFGHTLYNHVRSSMCYQMQLQRNGKEGRGEPAMLHTDVTAWLYICHD